MKKFVFIALSLLFLALCQARINYISEHVINDLKKKGRADFLIEMKEEINYDTLDLKSMDYHTKGRVVVAKLQEIAKRSQKGVLELLKSRNVQYESFWISNTIAVIGGDAELLLKLNERDDIAKIYNNAPFKVPLESPDVIQRVDFVGNVSAPQPEWNIEFIQAPAVWAKGFRGKGFTVASADTGVDDTHEAIGRAYRGRGASTHDYHWWDGVRQRIGSNRCGYNLTKPCDDNGHGTHTVGTMLGYNSQRAFGVAPEAKWIACRNMDGGVGRPQTYISCLQFFLAPHDLNGQNPKPELRPAAIGNSYGCPSSEFCDYTHLKRESEALRAAGVFMSVAAGNSGPGCGTVNDVPGIHESVISIAASGYKTTNIAYFSSRGPVTAYNRRKPDLTAPGMNVYSCLPGNKYASYSGTSMATPHVAGAVALLWEANPDLIGDVDATQKILQDSA
jgi:serine protease AprX